MAELMTLSTFIIILTFCVLTGKSILIALAGGLLCFTVYALVKKHTPLAVIKMIIDGISSAKNILLVFALIGILTALWRAGGTIPYIIYYSIRIINPSYFVMFTFLLCCIVSVLTGTSFGTASTMGVICMSIGLVLDIDPFFTGGAILSGIYFGDRCSAMSSSALLVSELTNTELIINIKNMLKTSAIPFIITTAIYAFTGSSTSSKAISSEIVSIYSYNFYLGWWVIIPALIVLALPMMHIKVKKTMIISIAASILICSTAQNMTFQSILTTAVFGYRSIDPDLAAVLNGGGLVSMVRSGSIVGLSSSYFGIFRNTDLLTEIKKWILALSMKTSSFLTAILSAVVMSAISCNQTLATMLTYELINKLVPDKYRLAIYLENTSIVIAPLIPWSIAGAFPLAAVGAPTSSILYAVYLYILPLYSLFIFRDK